MVLCLFQNTIETPLKFIKKRELNEFRLRKTERHVVVISFFSVRIIYFPTSYKNAKSFVKEK